MGNMDNRPVLKEGDNEDESWRPKSKILFLLQKIKCPRTGKPKGKAPFEMVRTRNQKRALATCNPTCKSRGGLKYIIYKAMVSIIDAKENQLWAKIKAIQVSS